MKGCTNRKIGRLLRAMLVALGTCVACLANSGAFAQKVGEGQPPHFTLMGLGDSITEGGETFSSYLLPLWEKLFAAGYLVDFVGPNQTETQIGPLRHAGFSGQAAEFLDKNINSIYSEFPADIVLLHAGHNHFVEENHSDTRNKNPSLI